MSGKEIKAQYGPERPGDVKHSLADISKIGKLLGYKRKVSFKEGLARVYRWYEEQNF